jgi:uncharacterized MAPEG superfamily protein
MPFAREQRLERTRMTTDLRMLIYATVLTWIMLFTASVLRTHSWTPSGMKVGFGNRDDVPEPTPLAARADRAAKNMLENLVLFVAAMVAVRLSGADPQRVSLGAQLFFYARVVYFGVYLAGIAYLRTLVWAISLIGIAMVLGAVQG